MVTKRNNHSLSIDFMRAALVHNSRALLKEKLTIRRHPRSDTNMAGSMTESNLLSAVIPLAAEISPRQVPYDWEASGDSDSDAADDKDGGSLHSATSHEIDIDSLIDQQQKQSSTSGLSWTH
ncbi:hypothetical protein, partial, partial [Absidia glauca]